MKVADLVQDGIETRLYHPIVGEINWTEIGPGTGYCLYFAIGQEKDQPLVCDTAVLHDDCWEKME